PDHEPRHAEATERASGHALTIGDILTGSRDGELHIGTVDVLVELVLSDHFTGAGNGDLAVKLVGDGHTRPRRYLLMRLASARSRYWLLAVAASSRCS